MAGAATLAHAHTGHGADGFFQGLAHPLAADHLLAAVAVGLWSARALPPGRAWQGPAVFLSLLVLAALAAHGGFALPFVEQGSALSVLLFGAMLVLACRGAASLPTRGLAVVGVAALLHGLAHGAEAGGAALASYASGFLATTALLHAGGLGAGFALQHLGATLAQRLTWGMGAGLATAGFYLLGA